jgi:hypothetical protein
MRIDELERLERAATRAPWKVAQWVGRRVIEPTRARYPQTQYVCTAGGVIDQVGGDQDANAALIAAARNALPALLRAIKAGRECADDLESVLRARYEGTLDYPSQAQRFERDMEPVRALRAALAALEGTADA